MGQFSMLQRWLMPFDISVELFGQKYANPLIMASGTFGCGEVYEDFLDYSRIGAFVTKAVTKEPRAGNKPQRLVETPSGLLNAIGLQNEGLKNFIEDKLPNFENRPCKIWVNVSGASFEEYEYIVTELNPFDSISAFEINVSCPNVAHGGMNFGTSCNDIGQLTSNLKKISKKPIIIKLTPNVTSIAEMAVSAEQAGADGLTVANTFLGMAIDTEKRKPVLDNVTGGLSGPAIKPLALRCVYQVYKAVKIPIIACGGISNHNDVLEFLMAGASLVQIGTAVFKHPKCPEEIEDGLLEWGKAKNLNNISELRGVAHDA
jgi:dihydroorotate dehydrogenase (NAD+) catalytic subunit